MDSCIRGKNIYLKRLTKFDVTDRYVAWLNDSEINQYLESRFVLHNLEETKKFVESVTNDYNYLFGIFTNDSNEHIGNIKVGGINDKHSYADLGFIIGEKKYWGKGIATEAIRLATDFAFNTLKLHKVFGGVYAPNIGSIKAFEKNGFIQEGCRKAMYRLNGKFVDGYIYGKINEKYE